MDFRSEVMKRRLSVVITLTTLVHTGLQIYELLSPPKFTAAAVLPSSTSSAAYGISSPQSNLAQSSRFPLGNHSPLTLSTKKKKTKK